MKITGMLVALVVCAGCTTVNKPQGRVTTDALKEVTVPEVAFRHAALPDVVEFLCACGPGCIGHSGLHASQEIRGNAVVYRLRLCGHDLHDQTSPKCVLEPGEDRPLVRLGPELNLNTNNITIYDLIVVVAERAGATLDVDTDRVIIRVKKVDPPPETKQASGELPPDAF